MRLHVPLSRARASAAILSPSALAVILAATYLVAHVAFLPRNPTGVDATNFVLGVRDFDVTDHRPHPPGYPVFIALGKASAAVLDRFGSPSAESIQLDTYAVAMWSAVCGALAVFVLRRLFSELEAGDGRAIGAAALTITCPLFWFNGSRAMSDLTGLAAALTSQAFAVAAVRRGRTDDRGALKALVLSALIAGAGVGVRSQVIWLTLPIVSFASIGQARRSGPRAPLLALAALLAGASVWAVPLVVANGGPASYVEAIAQQANEDIASGTLLAVDPSARAAAAAIIRTVAYPWGHRYLAIAILGLAAIGFGRLTVKSPGSTLLLAAAFGPYGVYHLLLQDTTYVRYALPLVPAVAYLAVRGLEGVPGPLRLSTMTALVIACLLIGVPPALSHARSGSPSLRALDAIRARLSESERQPVLGMHHAVSRVLRLEALPGRVLDSPPGREWLELVKYWRAGGDGAVWFFAEPERLDLALIDPHARRLVGQYRVAVDQRYLLAGVRPSGVDLYQIDRPGWFAGEGWALTTETAGVAAAARRGPAYGPVDVYVRRRDEPAIMVLGGRHLDASASPARFELSIDHHVIDEWVVQPGKPFLRMMPMAAGVLRMPPGAPGIPFGSRYARLQVRSNAADGSGSHVRTSIEQFDLQSADRVVFGFGEGWFEQEYDLEASRAWRWMAPLATLHVHHGDRDVLLVASGDAPIDRLEGGMTLVVRAGDHVIDRRKLAGEFDLRIRIPAAALVRAGGRLTLDSDRSFVPAATGDRRTLALRFYRLQLESGSNSQ